MHFGKNSVDYSLYLQTLSHSYELKGDIIKAIDLEEQALRSFKLLLGEGYLETMNAYLRLG